MRRRSSQWVITNIDRPEWPGNESWSPLVVIGNNKSGNNDGATILPAFRGQLNPAQVTDLSQSSVKQALRLCQKLRTPSLCLVAGGDGTIGWVLNTIDEMGLEPPPALVLIPLGTGNDLARSLGYGPGADASINVREVMKDISKSRTVMLDRWKIMVDPVKHFGKILL